MRPIGSCGKTNSKPVSGIPIARSKLNLVVSQVQNDDVVFKNEILLSQPSSQVSGISLPGCKQMARFWSSGARLTQHITTRIAMDLCVKIGQFSQLEHPGHGFSSNLTWKQARYVALFTEVFIAQLSCGSNSWVKK